jgi:hypothetical protein
MVKAMASKKNKVQTIIPAPISSGPRLPGSVPEEIRQRNQANQQKATINSSQNQPKSPVEGS